MGTDRIRKIIHIDMDAFFASVEQRDHPELRGKPVIVGGDPKGRGVVAAASYEARKFGVRSAISCAKAARLCPQGIFVKPDISRYAAVSRQLREILHSVTPQVEPLSLDEAYLDVTENLLGEPLARKIAEHLKKRIKTELNLTASAGVGPNKFIAKVASDFKKPDGLVVVPPEKVMAFVEKLPIERFWGVGPATAKKLHSMGIWNAADIRARKLEELEAALGSFAEFLYGLAHGEDDREVEIERESKSHGTETTFSRDIRDTDELIRILGEQAEELSGYLRRYNQPGRTVTLKLRYADFQTITRSRTLPTHTDDPKRIADVAASLLLENTEAGARAVRLIGISVSGLADEETAIQLTLKFPPPWDRL